MPPRRTHGAWAGLALLLLSGCTVSKPEHRNPVLTGTIAELRVRSRAKTETRWNLVLDDVEVRDGTDALESRLAANEPRFVTTIENPYGLLRYRGNFVGDLVGRRATVHLDHDLGVVAVEGDWQVPGDEGGFVADDEESPTGKSAAGPETPGSDS